MLPHCSAAWHGVHPRIPSVELECFYGPSPKPDSYTHRSAVIRCTIDVSTASVFNTEPWLPRGLDLTSTALELCGASYPTPHAPSDWLRFEDKQPQSHLLLAQRRRKGMGNKGCDFFTTRVSLSFEYSFNSLSLRAYLDTLEPQQHNTAHEILGSLMRRSLS